ncbi:MAG TPA: 2-dehydropantoate 2-reductase, partial [Acidimicrobiales bacterium]|nr:2-dehydropantoate 2-reductase [Acidimicrobiales bacterium]
MRIAVLGAGAIGAYVGACLERGGAEVTLIARGPHLEALRARGVRVLSPLGDFSAHPAATDRLDAVAQAEVVFVALKAYSLPALAEHLGAALDPGAAAIWAQNGVPWWYFSAHRGPLEGTVLQSVDPGGVIARSIRPGQSIGCVVYCATELVEPGVVRHIEGTRFAIGEPDGSPSPRCRAIAEAFASGGLKAPPSTDLREQIWLKLLGNVAFNP